MGRVTAVNAAVEYAYAGNGSHQAVLWDRIVQHSIRPGFADGFLFPYQEIGKFAKDDPSIDPASLVAFVPDHCWSQFSFVSEHVTHDSAVARRAGRLAVIENGRVREAEPAPNV